MRAALALEKNLLLEWVRLQRSQPVCSPFQVALASFFLQHGVSVLCRRWRVESPFNTRLLFVLQRAPSQPLQLMRLLECSKGKHIHCLSEISDGPPPRCRALNHIDDLSVRCMFC